MTRGKAPFETRLASLSMAILKRINQHPAMSHESRHPKRIPKRGPAAVISVTGSLRAVFGSDSESELTSRFSGRHLLPHLRNGSIGRSERRAERATIDQRTASLLIFLASFSILSALSTTCSERTF